MGLDDACYHQVALGHPWRVPSYTPRHCTNISRIYQFDYRLLHSKEVFPFLHHNSTKTNATFWMWDAAMVGMHPSWSVVCHNMHSRPCTWSLTTPEEVGWQSPVVLDWNILSLSVILPPVHNCSLNTKHKTASLPINAAFCCGGLHAIKRKILLKNEGCMPSPFPFTHILPLPTKNSILPSLPKFAKTTFHAPHSEDCLLCMW